MSGCAVTHKTQRIHLQRPTTKTKHTPQGTIALPKSQSTANRSLHSQQVKGKSLKGPKQADAPYAPAENPTRTRPRHRQTNPNNLERFFPKSSKQLVVNSTPWCPSTCFTVAGDTKKCVALLSIRAVIKPDGFDLQMSYSQSQQV